MLNKLFSKIKYVITPLIFLILLPGEFIFPVNILDSLENTHLDYPADNIIDKESISGGILDVSPIKPLKNILITGVNDAWALIKSPVNWDSTAFIVVPSIVLATYFLMILDKPISFNLLADKKYADSKLIKAAEFYGRNVTTEFAAAGFALAGIALNEKSLVRIGLEIFESYYFANNIHSIIKRTFGRARPFEEKGAYYFDPFIERKNPLNAFPSGHATIAFSLSTVLAAHVDNIFLKAAAFTPAVLTCFSRMYQNYHWASDVFLGATLGYVIGNFVVERHKNLHQDFFSIGFDEHGRISLIFPLK